MTALRLVSIAAVVAAMNLLPGQYESPQGVVGARGFQPAHSYAIDELESLDVATGSLGLRIPLASLPPGPAGLTASVSLVYNSKLWDVRPDYSFQGVPFSNWPTHDLEYRDEGGWRLNYGYELEYHTLLLSSQDACPAPASDTITKLRVILPDGSKHLLSLSHEPRRSAFAPTAIWGPARSRRRPRPGTPPTAASCGWTSPPGPIAASTGPCGCPTAPGW